MYSSCEWLTRLTRLMTWDDNQSSHMIVCCQKSSRNNGINFNVCFHFMLNYTEIPLNRSALTCFGQGLTSETVSPSLCNKKTFVDIQKTSSTVNSIQIWTWFSMCSSPLAALYVHFVYCLFFGYVPRPILNVTWKVIAWYKQQLTSLYKKFISLARGSIREISSSKHRATGVKPLHV